MRKAFTLIEMLVVMIVLAILAGAVVAIGGQVKAASARRSTLTTLKACEALMAEYLAAGNPEPQPVPTDSWTYGPPGPSGYNSIYHGYPPPPSLWLPTATPSDPINWVRALRAVPELRGKVEALPRGLDIKVRVGNTANGQGRVEGEGTNPVVLDAWGGAIRYVPSTSSKQGYFISAGPDGKFYDIAVNSTFGNYASWHGYPVNKNDDVFSYDPQ